MGSQRVGHARGTFISFSWDIPGKIILKIIFICVKLIQQRLAQHCKSTILKWKKVSSTGLLSSSAHSFLSWHSVLIQFVFIYLVTIFHFRIETPWRQRPCLLIHWVSNMYQIFGTYTSNKWWISKSLRNSCSGFTRVVSIRKLCRISW